MKISEAVAALAPVGVTAIECRPYNASPVWYVTQKGNVYSYCTDLERLVWALSPSDDWEG